MGLSVAFAFGLHAAGGFTREGQEWWYYFCGQWRVGSGECYFLFLAFLHWPGTHTTIEGFCVFFRCTGRAGTERRGRHRLGTSMFFATHVGAWTVHSGVLAWKQYTHHRLLCSFFFPLSFLILARANLPPTLVPFFFSFSPAGSCVLQFWVSFPFRFYVNRLRHSDPGSRKSSPHTRGLQFPPDNIFFFPRTGRGFFLSWGNSKSSPPNEDKTS